MSVYTTYCGLTSCTVLLALSPGAGKEEGVDNRVGVVGIEVASQVPKMPGRGWSNSSH